MLPYVSTVLFAIHAAIKVGQKVRVMVEERIRDQDLILPPVGVFAPDLPDWRLDVKPFFEKEGQAFVAPPPKPGLGEDSKTQLPEGLYYALWQEKDKPANQKQLCLAYQRITQNLDPHREDDDVTGDYRRDRGKFYGGANALFVVKQWREGTDPKRPVWQRLAGTVVELALDYAKVAPGLFGGNGKGDRIVRSFLQSLDKVKFSKRHDELLLEVLQASLNVFAGQVDLVVADDTLALLMKRVTKTLVDRVEEAKNDPSKLLIVQNFRREMLQDILKLSAVTVAGQATRLLGSPDSKEEQLLDAVLRSLMDTVQAQTELSSQTLRAIYGAGLTAVAQNPALILPGKNGKPSHQFLSQLFTGTVRVLATAGQAGRYAIFTPDLASDIIPLALETLAQNARQLIDPQNPQEQLLVQALERISISFSKEFHQDQDLPRILAATFSQKHLAAIIKDIFHAVAQNPGALLPGTEGDIQRSALAQIMGAVVGVVRQDSQCLLTGDGYVKLFRLALEAFALNPDRLLNLKTANPLDNVMAKVMSGILTAAAENLKNGGRDLLWGDWLLQAMGVALTTVSKNTEGFLADPEVVTLVLKRLLKAASGVQANVLDAENLLAVFSPLLSRVLREGRDLLTQDDYEIIMKYLT